jgi:tRNA A37 threonylcarbamoyltransferase TsaD
LKKQISRLSWLRAVLVQQSFTANIRQKAESLNIDVYYPDPGSCCTAIGAMIALAGHYRLLVWAIQ